MYWFSKSPEEIRDIVNSRVEDVSHRIGGDLIKLAASGPEGLLIDIGKPIKGLSEEASRDRIGLGVENEIRTEIGYEGFSYDKEKSLEIAQATERASKFHGRLQAVFKFKQIDGYLDLMK